MGQREGALSTMNQEERHLTGVRVDGGIVGSHHSSHHRCDIISLRTLERQ